MARFNFEGWDFWTWFKGNGNTIKEVFKVGFPWVVSTFVTNEIMTSFLLTIVGKFILDCIDYWISK
jgi:hypothetical protein